ncbi:MAG: hypothetical protein KIT52_11560 [Anaerolineae bacterium]|nr:hypothetical protein [Anaerolineae bacterium]
MTVIDADSSPPGGRRASSRRATAAWLLLILLLGLPLITPLLNGAAVPCTHDGHLHYHRVAALAHAWGNGIYLTRWLPDLAFGYGYPFFVFREAAPLYAVLLPHLAGLALPAASNLFYALTILAAGIFMGLWARDVLGARAAVVSAVAYMAAPYVLVDALVRGNAPESLALPLLPFLLWVGRRWVLGGSVRAFLAGALGLALLSFSHNISTFIFAPTLLVYLLALAVFGQRGSRGAGEPGRTLRSPAPPPPRSPAIFRAFALLALGLGLAFFYTGGAVLEMDEVTLERSTTTRNNDWRFNFATAGEILAPVAPEDPTLVNPPLRLRLGWAPALLAALGAAGLLWLRGTDARIREQRLHIWLMLAATAVYLFMALSISRPVWERLPLIDFVQFPWRFVGRAALPVAFLAGVPWSDGRPPTAAARSLSFIGLVVAVALLLLEAVPNLYPRLCVEEPFPTILTVHAYERATGLVGVDPEGSYFPRTVLERPTGSPLEADFAAGRAPQRFDATALPPGATLSDVVYAGHGVALTVSAPTAFTARYLSFAFPGWSARVDGAPVAITAEAPSGLITFPVPAGTHRVEVRWGATPLRLALVGLSGLAGVGVVVVAVMGRRRKAARVAWPVAHTARLRWREWAALALLALGLLAVKALVIDQTETPLRAATGPRLRAEEVAAIGSAEMRLEGARPATARVAAGETFDINMAWRLVAPATTDYQTEVWLEDADGLVWSVKGTERPRVFEDAPPTRQWAVGEWGWDSREVRVLSGAPPGDYAVVMTLFDKATLQPATLSNAGSGAVLGPTAIIGHVTVVNPRRAQPPEAQYPLDAAVPDTGLRLLGYNQDRAAAAPGDPVLLTLFLACDGLGDCARVRLQLLDEAGERRGVWDVPAIRAGLPAESWPAGGFLRGQHLLSLPRDLATGRYRFTLNGLPLGEISVTAPDRQFTAPPLAVELNAPFTAPDPVATLLGIATSPQPSCTPAPPLFCLPLVWRADGEPEVAYRVFVHLVDAAGNIIAQSDAAPANWTRPATGWLAGEVIVDTHALTLPEPFPVGPLTLRVGLYDPDTNARLTSGASDFVAIPWPVAP